MKRDINTVVFFRIDDDVLEPLSQSERLTTMLALRLVCKQWDEWVRQIHHVNLDDDDEVLTFSMLAREFSMLNSIKSSFALLCCEHLIFPRVNRLEIDVEAEERLYRKIDITQLPALQTLIIPHTDIIPSNISELTTLTRLEVMSFAHDVVYKRIANCVNLRHLKIRGLSEEFERERLTKLTYLHSDHPKHFIGFTGEGELLYDSGDIAISVDDLVDRGVSLVRRIDAYFIALGLVKNINKCRMKGQWLNGLLTGSVCYKLNHCTTPYQYHSHEGKNIYTCQNWTDHCWEGYVVPGGKS